MKVLHLELESCEACPYCNYESADDLYYCVHAEFIGDEPLDISVIHENCPLEDSHA